MDERLICCRRSVITAVDRQRLETAACECYRIVLDHRQRLLARVFD
jgi:hypothetical protein